MLSHLKKIKENGFTGIEILIVLTIVAIVALLVTNNISESVAEARDIERRTDISNIQNALEEYWHTNESYPVDLTTLNIETIFLTDPNNNIVLITPPTDSSNKPSSSYTVAQPDQEYTYAPYQCSEANEENIEIDPEESVENSEEDEDSPANELETGVQLEGCQKYVLYSWLEKAEISAIPYEKTNLHNTN